MAINYRDDEDDGAACGSGCGYCGRCSSGPRANATCADCDEPFYTLEAATVVRCDACWEARDAHTSALEEAHEIKRMAKALLSADLTTVKEVA